MARSMCMSADAEIGDIVMRSPITTRRSLNNYYLSVSVAATTPLFSPLFIQHKLETGSSLQ